MRRRTAPERATTTTNATVATVTFDSAVEPVPRWHVGLSCGHEKLLAHVPADSGIPLIGQLEWCPACVDRREVRTCGVIWDEG